MIINILCEQIYQAYFLIFFIYKDINNNSYLIFIFNGENLIFKTFNFQCSHVTSNSFFGFNDLHLYFP
jgi:hypothetical protein